MAETRDPKEAYFHFVGFFINEFAIVERTLRRILQRKAGLSDPLFAVLVGTPRTSDLIRKVKAVIASLSLEEADAKNIHEAFVQLAEITKIRDRIVHYGATPGLEKVRVYDRPAKEAPYAFGPFTELDQKQLWDAAADLIWVGKTFFYLLDDQSNMIETHREVLRLKGSWRYKLPQ